MKNNSVFLFCLIFTIIIISACSSSQPATTQPAPQLSVTNQPVEVKPTSSQSAVQPTAAQTAAGSSVSFSKDIFPIIQPFVNCHDNLSGYNALMPWVVAGQPENSKLWRRLNGQGGPQMPPDGKLPDAQLNLIYQWIKEGAQNN